MDKKYPYGFPWTTIDRYNGMLDAMRSVGLFTFDEWSELENFIFDYRS